MAGRSGSGLSELLPAPPFAQEFSQGTDIVQGKTVGVDESLNGHCWVIISVSKRWTSVEKQLNANVFISDKIANIYTVVLIIWNKGSPL